MARNCIRHDERIKFPHEPLFLIFLFLFSLRLIQTLASIADPDAGRRGIKAFRKMFRGAFSIEASTKKRPSVGNRKQDV